MKIINLNTIESAKNAIKNKKVGFEIDPLDLGIAKIQFNLQKRLVREVPEHGDFAPVLEKFVSKDSSLNISEIEVLCKFFNKDVPKKSHRIMEVNVRDKAGVNTYNYIFAQGDKNDMISAANNNMFFQICKSVALSVDEGIK